MHAGSDSACDAMQMTTHNCWCLLTDLGELTGLFTFLLLIKCFHADFMLFVDPWRLVLCFRPAKCAEGETARVMLEDCACDHVSCIHAGEGTRYLETHPHGK